MQDEAFSSATKGSRSRVRRHDVFSPPSMGEHSPKMQPARRSHAQNSMLNDAFTSPSQPVGSPPRSATRSGCTWCPGHFGYEPIEIASSLKPRHHVLGDEVIPRELMPCSVRDMTPTRRRDAFPDGRGRCRLDLGGHLQNLVEPVVSRRVPNNPDSTSSTAVASCPLSGGQRPMRGRAPAPDRAGLA